MMNAEHIELPIGPVRRKRVVVVGDSMINMHGEQGKNMVSFQAELTRMLPQNWEIKPFACFPGGDLSAIAIHIHDNQNLESSDAIWIIHHACNELFTFT